MNERLSDERCQSCTRTWLNPSREEVQSDRILTLSFSIRIFIFENQSWSLLTLSIIVF